MPKNKSKGKKGAAGAAGKTSRQESGGSDDDGSTFGDTASLVSYAGNSDGSALTDENAVDESSSGEAFEGKLKDAIDLAMEKSAATRTNAFKALCQGLLKR